MPNIQTDLPKGALKFTQNFWLPLYLGKKIFKKTSNKNAAPNERQTLYMSAQTSRVYPATQRRDISIGVVDKW